MRFTRTNRIDSELQRSNALQGRLVRTNGLSGLFTRVFTVVLEGLALSSLVSTASFGTPTLAKATPQELAPASLASSSSFGTPTVALASAQVISPDTLASSASFGLVTLALDSSASLLPATLASGSSLGSPTIAHATPQALAPDSLASSSDFGLPTVALNPQSLSLASLSSSSAFGSPTIAAATPQALSLDSLASGASFGAVTIAAAGGPTEISAADDAKVHKDSGTTNYDGSVLSVMDYFAALRETFLAFEGCPASSTATLKLVYTGSGGTFVNDLNVYAASGTQFDETTLTWNNKPSVTSLKGSVMIDTSTLSWGDEIEIPLTGLSFDGSGNITLRVVASYTSGTLTYTNFGNAEHANSALHPKLIFS